VVIAFILVRRYPLTMRKKRKLFALTMNTKLVHRLLFSPDHRKVLEGIVDDYGLEHLADLRLLSSDGTFEDLSSFSSSFNL
jgi:hypothetical protein